MPRFFGAPYRFRTWLRSRSPWVLIDLGVFDKGADCEAAGGDHECIKWRSRAHAITVRWCERAVSGKTPLSKQGNRVISIMLV